MKATALVLAGGRATRMGGIPKCLLPLYDGRSILEHLVEALEHAHVTPVILGGVDEAVVTQWRTGFDVLTLPDEERFGGTARAIAGASKFFNHRKDDRFLLCYGDTFLPGFDYASACYPGTLTVGAFTDLHGNVEMSSEGVRYFPLRADGTGDTPRYWLELGATCVRSVDLVSIGRQRELTQWLATRRFNRICLHDGPVLTTGDPKRYEHAKAWTP